MLYGQLPTVTIDGKELHGVTVKVANPPKSAVLALPTNEQMMARLNQNKLVRRTLGRGKTQTEFLPNRQADLDLFQKIRQDSGLEFDEYEASNALGKLLRCDAIDCQPAGGEYRITLQTPFGAVVHAVRSATLKEITLYRSALAGWVDLPHAVEELRPRSEPGLALYDAVATGIEGYALSFTPKDVPPHHKSAVVMELVNALDALDADLDPNF
jgi:hypothetical protein